MCGHIPDVVIYAKFHRNPFRGFEPRGSKFAHSHCFGYWHLQQLCTVQAVISRDYCISRTSIVCLVILLKVAYVYGLRDVDGVFRFRVLHFRTCISRVPVTSGTKQRDGQTDR